MFRYYRQILNSPSKLTIYLGILLGVVQILFNLLHIESAAFPIGTDAAILILLIGIAIAVTQELPQVLEYLTLGISHDSLVSDPNSPRDLDSRLRTLTKALIESGQVISAIEEEIQYRQELVKKLEQQKTIAEQAIKLSKEQVDAVAALLSKEIDVQNARLAKELDIKSKRDFQREIVKDIILIFIGLFIGAILRALGVPL